MRAGVGATPASRAATRPTAIAPTSDSQVAGVGEQRERVRQEATDHRRHQQRHVDRERHPHAAPVARPARVQRVRVVVPVMGYRWRHASRRGAETRC